MISTSERFGCLATNRNLIRFDVVKGERNVEKGVYNRSAQSNKYIFYVTLDDKKKDKEVKSIIIWLYRKRAVR